jgi:hypothetical protein
MSAITILRYAMVGLYFVMEALPALATGNCANGQTLYATPVSGLSCASSSCHKADPSAGANKILNGANNPTKIATAINGGVPEMAVFQGKYTASDLSDIATWIAAAPTCPAAGTPVIGVAPASYTFPTAQNVGSTSAATTITVSNTGTAAASGVSIANSNAAEFPTTNTCSATLAIGASCTISAAFSPSAAGSRSATLTVNSSAGAKTVALAGTGSVVAAGALSMPAPYAFAAQTVGSPSAPHSFTLTNTGGSAVTISSVASSNAAEFPVSGSTCTGSVGAGASCSFSVTFTPSTAGARSTGITVTSTGTGSPQSIAVTGTGKAATTSGVLSIPGPYAFAAQTVGTASAPHAFTLTNTGGTAVTISAVASGNAAEFAISSSTCAGSVAAGSSCSFSVTFTPSAAGARSSSVSVTSTGTGSPQTLAITGTGTTPGATGVLSVPKRYLFARQKVGTSSAPHAFSLTNTGGVPVAISGVTSSNAAEFAISNSTCSGSLAAGTRCSFRVTFTPSAKDRRSTTVSIISTGVGSPQLIAIAGRGTSDQEHGEDEETEEMIEYHHSGFDHYFMTTGSVELTALDAGSFAGWARTGNKFKVFSMDEPATATVCRFFSAAFAPKSSHFFTSMSEECALAKTYPAWTFEGEVFNVVNPEPDGTCETGTVPVYRLYNNGQGDAPGHRYTTSTEVRDQMVASGWILEGNLPGLAVMCTPQ